MSVLISVIVLWILIGWKTEYKLWLLIIFSIDVFSIFSGTNVPHLILPGFGTFHLKDMILIFMVIHASLNYRKISLSIKENPLVKQLIMLLAIGILNTLIDLVEGIEIHYLLRGYRYVAYYFAFFVTVREIKSKETLYRFISGIIFLSVISSLVVYLQSILGWSLSGGKVSFMHAYGFYRVYNASGAVTSGCLLILFSIGLSNILQSKFHKLIIWSCVLFLMGSQILIFSRSRWGYIIIGIIFIFMFQRKLVIRNIVFVTLLSIVLYFVLEHSISYFLGNENLSLRKSVTIRAMIGVEDFKYHGGTFDIRLRSLSTKWKTVKSRNPLIGIGFESAVPIIRYTSQRSMSLILHQSPYALVPDISWSNIILLFGLLGVFIFLWMFLSFFRFSYMVFRKLPDSVPKYIVLGIISFNITTLLSSFFSSSALTGPAGVTFLSMTWAIVVLINHFELSSITYRPAKLPKYIVNRA